jgi:hypothetical protein
MASAPHNLDAAGPRCHLATTFAQIVEQSMLRRVTETTTAEQFQVLQQSLILLCMELEAQADWRHYQAAGTRRHCCVRDIYTQAAFILKNLSLTTPPLPVPAQPPAPPAPKPQPLSDEDLMERLKTYVTERTNETFFGQEQAGDGEAEETQEESA